MILSKKEQRCKWHRCDIGKRYHHTMEEWVAHQEFANTDIATVQEEQGIAYPQYVPVENSNIRPQQQDGGGGALPMPEYRAQQPCVNRAGRHDNIWRIAAVGTMVAVWIMILWRAWP